MPQVRVFRLHFVDKSKVEGEELNKLHVKIAKLGPYQVVVGDHYEEGQLGFHIPANAIVPDKIAEEMWLKGKLAGRNKNKVKDRKMYGVTSEGLFYGAYYFHDGNYIESSSWNPSWQEEQDITAEIGVEFNDDTD
jgi:hypothetical protein